jgi:hypothetical protein
MFIHQATNQLEVAHIASGDLALHVPSGSTAPVLVMHLTLWQQLQLLPKPLGARSKKIDYREALQKAVMEEKFENGEILSGYNACLAEDFYPGWSVEKEPHLTRMTEIGTGRAYTIPVARFNKAAGKLLTKVLKWRMLARPKSTWVFFWLLLFFLYLR